VNTETNLKDLILDPIADKPLGGAMPLPLVFEIVKLLPSLLAALGLPKVEA
jgi:hypothetical protein